MDRDDDVPWRHVAPPAAHVLAEGRVQEAGGCQAHLEVRLAGDDVIADLGLDELAGPAEGHQAADAIVEPERAQVGRVGARGATLAGAVDADPAARARAVQQPQAEQLSLHVALRQGHLWLLRDAHPLTLGGSSGDGDRHRDHAAGHHGQQGCQDDPTCAHARHALHIGWPGNAAPSPLGTARAMPNVPVRPATRPATLGQRPARPASNRHQGRPCLILSADVGFRSRRPPARRSHPRRLRRSRLDDRDAAVSHPAHPGSRAAESRPS